MYSKDIQVFRWERNTGLIGLGQETRVVNPIASAQRGNVWLAAIANVRRETGICLFDNTGNTIETIAALDVPRIDPMAISQNGAVVVGRRKSQQGFGFEGFVWEKSVGFTSLGSDSTATDVSNDGVRVCGEKENADGYSEAFVWSKADGFDWLGDLPGGHFQSRADCISGDGRVVVGRGWSRAGHNKLFIWSGKTGMIEVQGRFWSPVTLDISDDGAIFVGYDNSGSNNNAFVHTTEFGYERLTEYFSRNEVDTSDWKRFDSAESISADGRTILGTGTYKTGQRTAFLIDIGG